MSNSGKPLWRVIAEPTKTDKKKELRTYHVIAPEMETTPRGTRSNEWNVREVCEEKGYNIIGIIFLGYVSQAPVGTIDISNVPEETEEEVKPKRVFKKKFIKR